LSLPNALLSPHIAGPTEDTLPILGEFALNNLQRYMNGDEVEGLVSLEIYDRST
jgi:phosphoglycerate dehydrogenase-like enzyme